MILHDNLNPSVTITIDAEHVVTATPYGSGAALHLSNGQLISVQETPEQVERLRQEEKERQ